MISQRTLPPDSNLMVFSGNAHPKLAKDVCDDLNIPLGKAHVGQFSDGEVQVEIQENVRGKDVFVVQPTCMPTNNNVMELLIMVDALKRSSAERITTVIPYFWLLKTRPTCSFYSCANFCKGNSELTSSGRGRPCSNCRFARGSDSRLF